MNDQFAAYPAGAELARDEAITFTFIGDWTDALASKLGSCGVWVT